MSRIATILVVALGLLWQSVALAGWTVDLLGESEHTLLHWQDEGHHHHDDGSFHVDDSEDSTRHMLADHGSPASTGYDGSMPVPLQADGLLNAGGARAGPQPDPDGLLRPPRPHS